MEWSRNTEQAQTDGLQILSSFLSLFLSLFLC